METVETTVCSVITAIGFGLSCYSHLIEKVLYGVPKNCDDMTVNDFAEIHPQGTYLLRMNGHITTLIDYTVFDLFDCREYFITNAWEIR